MNSEQKAILFDIDNTLVFGPEAKSFYTQYSRRLEEKIAQVLSIPLAQAVELANDSRKRNDGQGELVFEEKELDPLNWYYGILAISPIGKLLPLPEVDALLASLSRDGYILGAITDGPTPQAYSILQTTQIEKDRFAFIWGWEPDTGKPKNGKSEIYMQAAKELGIAPSNITMVGDSLRCDVLPARKVGARGILINEKLVTNQTDTDSVRTVLELPNILTK